MSRKQNFKSNKRRRGKGKAIASVIAAVFAAVLLLVGIVALTAPKELNPDNLLKYSEYVNKLEESKEGLKVKWDDDGSFALSGKHESNDTSNNSKYKSPFASVVLDKGNYLISTGNDNCDSEKYGMYYVLDGEYYEVCGDVLKIKVDSKTVLEVGFFVKNNVRIIHADFEPVLVPEGSSVSFYSK